MNIECVIVKTISVKDYFDVNQYNNGIVEVIWSDKLDIVEVAHIKKIQEVIKELGNGKDLPIYTVTHSFMSISKEASKLSETSLYTKANAILIDELGKRLLFNFYVKLSKHKAPIKSFPNREDAFEWLLSF